MFLRATKRFKDGKLHYYWSLVESVRVGRRVFQRRALYLGELNDSQREEWQHAVEALDEKGNVRQLKLFPEDRAPETDDGQVVRIRMDSLAVKNIRNWGEVWLGTALWDKLGLDGFWAPRLPPSRKGTDWLAIMKAIVMYRLTDPGSELDMHTNWLANTAVAELVGAGALTGLSTLYSCLDRVMWPTEEWKKPRGERDPALSFKDDLVRRRDVVKDEQYLAPKMLGHVYNACGNIPGALKEFEKAIELIKGTKYEKDGLSFLYLGMAHIQLNNNSAETLKWLDKDLEELARNKDQKDYWRGLTDAYAMKAIVMFKKRRYADFHKYIALAEQSDAKNANPQGDIFLPYARIYQTLLNGNTQAALAEVENLPNLKERYLVSCDIYTYLGNTDKAFLLQRELMHTRDSITGVIIAENIQNQEEEMFLLNQKQKAARIMNIVLVIAMVLALMLIVALALSIYGRRRLTSSMALPKC